MRNAIIGLAILCYAAAAAIAGAWARLPGRPSEPQLRAAVAGLARDQAADRELVTGLQSTVKRLQDELARRPVSPPGEDPAGRTLAVIGGSGLPPVGERLLPDARAAVRRLVPEIQADPRRLVSVEGHTDNRPIRAPEEKVFKDNMELSLLRARAVADALVREGVAAERIRATGWGDTRPLAANDTAPGRELNRRVEIRLLPPEPGP